MKETDSLKLFSPVVIISAVVVFAFFLFPVSDFDIWFHLKDGQLLIENHSLPQKDLYSYSATGLPWRPNSWGFDALAYLIQKFAGLNVLNLVKALVSLSVFVLIIFFLERKKSLNLFSLLFVVLALYSIRDGFSLRPHTFYYPLLIAFLILLFDYWETKHWQTIFFLFLIEVLWVNFHPSALFGIGFSGAVLLSETIVKKKVDYRDLILVTAVFAGALMHFFYGPAFLIKTVSEYFSSYHPPIREFLAPGAKDFFSLTGLVLLSWFILVYFCLKEKRFDLLIISFALAFLGIKSARFLRDLVLFLSLASPLYFSRLPHLSFKPLVSKKAQALLYFFILAGLFLAAKNSKAGIGIGLEKFIYPVKAIEFIKQEKLLEKSGGNLYNTYNFGGYLIWNLPEHKVFIDGRLEPYAMGEEKIFDLYWSNFEGGESWQRSIKKYDLTLALMCLPHTDGKTVYNQSYKMFPEKDWALIYYDDAAMVYAKRIPELEETIDRYEYKIINPQEMDFDYLEEQIKSEADFKNALNEIEKGLVLNPESYRLHFTRAYLYGLSGDQSAMIKELEKTVEINPNFKASQEILEQMQNEPD